MRYFLIVVAAALIAGCGGDSEDPLLVTGRMESGSPSAIDLEHDVNAFIESRCPSASQSLYQVAVYQSSNDDKSLWTLTFQVPANVNEIIHADETEFRLFRNYKARAGGSPCQINQEFDEERVFLATGGYVDFRTARQGEFNLEFDREPTPGSGNTVGDPVEVQGCWRVSTDSNSCWSGWTNTNAED